MPTIFLSVNYFTLYTLHFLFASQSKYFSALDVALFQSDNPLP